MRRCRRMLCDLARRTRQPDTNDSGQPSTEIQAVPISVFVRHVGADFEGRVQRSNL